MEREGKAGKKERKRNVNWLPLLRTDPGDQTCDSGMLPDGELNPRPLALWEDAQPTEPQVRAGLLFTLNRLVYGLQQMLCVSSIYSFKTTLTNFYLLSEIRGRGQETGQKLCIFPEYRVTNYQRPGLEF